MLHKTEPWSALRAEFINGYLDRLIQWGPPVFAGTLHSHDLLMRSQLTWGTVKALVREARSLLNSTAGAALWDYAREIAADPRAMHRLMRSAGAGYADGRLREGCDLCTACWPLEIGDALRNHARLLPAPMLGNGPDGVEVGLYS